MKSLRLNIEQKKVLINIAQETIENVVRGKNPANYDTKDHILNMKCGAFVTLHLNKNLRGCIGNIVAEIPLWKTVRNMAKESALNDPRFPPVSPFDKRRHTDRYR